MNRIIILIFMLLVIASCSPIKIDDSQKLVTVYPTSTRLPTKESTSTNTPFNTFTPTITPTFTSTSTPDLPVGLGTQSPMGLPEISPDNINNLVPIASFGEGEILNILPWVNGENFTVLLSNGFAVYEINSLEQIDNFNLQIPATEYNPAILSPHGKFFAFFTLNGVDIWSVETKSRIAKIPIEGNINYSEIMFSPNENSLLIISRGFNTKSYLVDLPSGNIISEEKITDATYSPDGSILALGNRNVFHVLILDTNTGEEITRLNGRTFLSNINFSPDGKYIATSYKIDTWIWDVANFEKIFEFSGKANKELIFSPDSKFLYASSSNPDAVRIWRMEDGIRISTLTEINKIEISPNGKFLLGEKISRVNGIWARSIQFINLDTEKSITLFVDNVYDHSIKFVFTKNSSKAFIEIGRNNLVINTKDGTIIANYENESNIQYLDDDNLLISQKDRILVFRNAENGKFILNSSKGYPFDNITNIPNSNQFISWGESGGVQLWDSNSGKLLASGRLPQSAEALFYLIEENRLLKKWPFISITEYTKYKNMLYSYRYNKTSPDGKIIILQEDNLINFYNKGNGNTKGEILYSIPAISTTTLGTLIYSHNGEYFSAFQANNTIGIWKKENGDLIKSINIYNYISNIRFFPDNKFIAGITFIENSNFRTINIWEISSSTLIKSITYKESNCWYRPFEISPNGNSITVSGDNCTLQIIDPNDNWKSKYVLDVGIGIGGKITYSPNGKIVVTAFQGGEVKFWSVESGELLFFLTDHENFDMSSPSVNFDFFEDGSIFEISRGFPADVITYWGIFP